MFKNSLGYTNDREYMDRICEECGKYYGQHFGSDCPLDLKKLKKYQKLKKVYTKKKGE